MSESELKVIEWVHATNIATLILNELEKRHFCTENKSDADGLRDAIETIVVNELRNTNQGIILEQSNEEFTCGCEGLHHPEECDLNRIVDDLVNDIEEVKIWKNKNQPMS